MTEILERAAEKARSGEAVLAIEPAVSASPSHKTSLAELAQRLSLTFWPHVPSLGGDDFIVVGVEVHPDQGGCR
jgi:hypothetical protein